MYVITADDTVAASGTGIVTYEGTVIHASGSDDKQFLAITAGLSLEISKSGSLSLTLPPTNYALRSGKLKKLKTIIRVYKDFVRHDNLIWKGRILDTSRDFIGRITYNCEGWMSVLCDSVVRPVPNLESDEKIVRRPDEMFMELIRIHNSQVEEAKQLNAHVVGFNTGESEASAASTYSTLQIWDTGDEVTLLQQYLNKLDYTVGVDGIFGPATESAVKAYQTNKGLTADGIVGSDTWDALEADISGSGRYVATSVEFPNPSYENTLDYIQTNLLQNIEIGGSMYIDESDIYYVAEGHEGYGKQDIVFGQNLIDFTESIDASEIYTVLIPVGKDDLMLDLDGADYVEDADAISLFGRIVRKEDFSDIESAEQLEIAARKTLSDNIKENTTIDISAFDLSLLNVEDSSFKVGEYVRIISEPHKVDSYYLCTASEIDLCNPARSSYTLGVNPDTLTAKLAHNRLPSWQYVSSSSSKSEEQIRTGEFQGIDVSEHNEISNWSAGVGYIQDVIVRVTRWNETPGSPYYHYLYDQIDLKFVENYTGAKNANYRVGAYVFTNGLNAADIRHEAEAAVAILRQYNCELNHPVWMDPENPAQERLSKDVLAQMIEAFREVIEGAGYEFGIYTNRNWYTYILPEYVKTKYPLWIASFPDENYDDGSMKESLRPSYGIGWQYSGVNTIPNFQRSGLMLDRDVFYRTWETRRPR